MSREEIEKILSSYGKVELYPGRNAFLVKTDGQPSLLVEPVGGRGGVKVSMMFGRGVDPGSPWKEAEKKVYEIEKALFGKLF